MPLEILVITKRGLELERLFTQMRNSGFESDMLAPILLRNNEVPWLWIGDPDVSFIAYYNLNTLVGITVGRHLKLTSHLHLLWVVPGFRGLGFGAEIMNNFFKFSINIKSETACFTAHVYRSNVSAVKFYKNKLLFNIYSELTGSINNAGLKQWISNCKSKSDWPLRSAVDLIWRDK